MIKRRSAVHQWSVGRSSRRYDLAILALGYERRATFLAQTVLPEAPIRYALGFKDRHVLSYAANERWFRGSGYRIEELDDCEFSTFVDGLVHTLARSGRSHYRVFVDISSFSRIRLAY